MTSQQFANAFTSRYGYSSTKGHLRKLGASEDLAEEISSLAWAHAWDQIAKLRKEESLCAFVKTIARHMFYKACGDRKPMAPAELLRELGVPPSVDPIWIALQVALAKCSAHHRDLLHAFYWEGYTCIELADLTGRTSEAVHADLYRARQELKGFMGITVLQMPNPVDRAPEGASVVADFIQRAS